MDLVASIFFAHHSPASPRLGSDLRFEAAERRYRTTSGFEDRSRNSMQSICNAAAITLVLGNGRAHKSTRLASHDFSSTPFFFEMLH